MPAHRGIGHDLRVKRLSAGIRPLALVILSTVLFGLAYPPHRMRWLAWIALAPFFLALRGASFRQALWLGWVWSVLAAYSVGQWMPGAIESYYQQTKLVGWLFFFGVATLMVAPYHTAFALCARRLWRGRGAALPILLAAGWTGAELLRGRLLTDTAFFSGNPWALLGYSQAGWLPMMQIADLGGVYAVTFVVAAANAGLAVAAVAIREGVPRRVLLACVATAAAPAGAAFLYGTLQITRVDMAEAAIPPVPVALVQGDVSFGSRWRSEYYGRDLEIYLRLTLDVLRQDRPRIVFWPESSMTFFLEQEPAYRGSIASVLAPFGAELVAGAPRASTPDGPPYLNSIYALSRTGEIAGRYDKQLLVPFGEYFPFGSIELLKRRFGPTREYSPGTQDAPIPTAAGPAGILVCNEAMLPEIAADRVAAGAAYLVNPSNDAWIPDEKFADLQFDLVALRAIEQRRYLVRASTSGPSAIVDSVGRLQDRTKAFERATGTGVVRPLSGRTVYGSVGDAFAVACLALAVTGCLIANGPRPRDPKYRVVGEQRHRYDDEDGVQG